MPVNPLFFAIGAVLATIIPRALAEERRRFTIASLDGSPRPLTRRFIRYYLGQRIAKDTGQLETVHHDFWRQQGQGDWFRFSEGRHKDLHVPMLQPVVERARPIVEAHNIEQVVEFGPGSGLWLDHLAHQWPSVKRFLGVDISPDQVRQTQSRFPQHRFVCSELVAWAEAHAAPGSLFLTNCGVLEYLSQASLERLLQTLVTRAPGSLMLFVEPIDEAIDLATDTASKPHGSELSFSHNHPHLLRQAGCRVLVQEEIRRAGYRWLVVMAEAPGA